MWNSRKLQKVALAYADKRLLFAVIILMLFGLLMVYSSSYINAQMLYEVTPLYFTMRHLVVVIACFVMMFVMTRFISVKIFFTLAWLGFGFSAVMLWALIPLGEIAGGAQSVIAIGPISFQPLEVAKMTTIIFVAAWYTKYMGIINFYMTHLKLILLVGFFVLLPLLLQPDLGGVLIIGATFLVMIFFSGIRLDKFLVIVLGLGVIAGGVIAVSFAVNPHQKERIETYLDPFTAYEETDSEGYQMVQSYVAIGNGGLTGVGFNNSIQKAGYLPEAHTDMIFAIIVEELGFVGALFTIGMELFIVLRIVMIGLGSRRSFLSLGCFGIGTLILVQTFVNIGGVTGFIPLTGVTLPFISYGSNAMLALCAGIGFVLSVSVRNRVDDLERKNKVDLGKGLKH